VTFRSRRALGSSRRSNNSWPATALRAGADDLLRQFAEEPTRNERDEGVEELARALRDD
jgi:hypothetical protein